MTTLYLVKGMFLSFVSFFYVTNLIKILMVGKIYFNWTEGPSGHEQAQPGTWEQNCGDQADSASRKAEMRVDKICLFAKTIFITGVFLFYRSINGKSFRKKM
jgi:hypothetical protein